MTPEIKPTTFSRSTFSYNPSLFHAYDWISTSSKLIDDSTTVSAKLPGLSIDIKIRPFALLLPIMWCFFPSTCIPSIIAAAILTPVQVTVDSPLE
jgi:hypothetical protein